MKLAILSMLNPGTGHCAPGFCKHFYPSYTVVHVSPFDFASATTTGAAKADPQNGLFTIEKPAGKNIPAKAIIESAPFAALFPFDSLIFSVNARLPEGSSFLAEVQAGIKNENGGWTWSPWYKMGRFAPDRSSESFPNQNDAIALVDIDTLKLKKYAHAFKYRVTLESRSDNMPVLRLAAVTYTDTKANYGEKSALKPLGEEIKKDKPMPWVRRLDVPKRSQKSEDKKYSKDVCSPTSLGMALEYWGLKKPTMDIGAAVYDNAGQIYGNWLFSVAYAGNGEFDAFVSRFVSAAEAEFEIAHLRPVIASITYGPNELKNSPITRTKGHLVVIKGFDESGDFLVNDPAADEKTVERVYRRNEFAKAWLANKYGLVYKVLPRLPRIMTVGVPLSNLRKEPVPPSDITRKDGLQESQLLMGEMVKVTEIKDGWAKVECLEQGYYLDPALKNNISDADHKKQLDLWKGYPGWMRLDELTWGDDYGFGYTVKSQATQAEIETPGGLVTVTLYMGTRLCPLEKQSGEKIRVLLPGGRAAFVNREDLQEAVHSLSGNKLREAIIETAAKFKERVYFWGGRSGKGIDCSGLVNLAYRVFGIDLPRNAHDQYLAARKIPKSALKKGDLIFLSEKDKPKFINHVMIYAGEEKILEATGDVMAMRETSFTEKLGKLLSQIKDGEVINGQSVYFGTVFKD